MLAVLFVFLHVIEGDCPFFFFFSFSFSFQEMSLEGKILMASSLPPHSVSLGGLTVSDHIARD